jgi:ferredoxin
MWSCSALMILVSLSSLDAFAPSPLRPSTTRLALSALTETTMLSLSLEKPLGMILEEVEEGAPKGVFVLDLAEAGSAASCPEKAKILGSKLITVMGDDVTGLLFDDVMDKIIQAPSPVQLQLLVEDSVSNAEDEFTLGTSVTVTVQRQGMSDLDISAKVGDNLRAVLLENQVEVYRGFKAKIGNCGGGGQCGFCAVEFVNAQGWEPRSDYEDKKIKNSPNSRLSCMNNIQGPVTIKM